MRATRARGESSSAEEQLRRNQTWHALPTDEQHVTRPEQRRGQAPYKRSQNLDKPEFILEDDEVTMMTNIVGALKVSEQNGVRRAIPLFVPRVK